MRKMYGYILALLLAFQAHAGSFLGDTDSIARASAGAAGVTANTALANAATADGKAVAAQGTADAAAAAVLLKANIASPALSGVPTTPTAAGGTNTTQIASTAFVTSAVATKANIASPALSGVPTTPTAAGGTNTTQIASTAFVTAAVSPAMSGSANDSTARTSAGTAQTTANTATAGSYAGATWHNVFGSRAFGSTYTNPTAHVMFVAITGSNGSVPVFSTDGVAVCSMDAARSQCNFPVRAGASYTSSVGGGTVNQWAEFY